MGTKTLTKFNRFGKIGKILMTILLLVAILTTLLLAGATIYTATLPKDAVKVAITNHAEFQISEDHFASVWNALVKSFSYASDKDPSSQLSNDSDSELLPPEDTELTTELKFLNRNYSSAMIHSEADEKIVTADSSPAEYRSSDLLTLLLFASLFSASVALALLMLRKLFQVLSVSESPFCSEFVAKLRAFGYSLLPLAVIASIGETLAVRFLSAGNNCSISIQWGVLLTFVVTMCLVTIFRYGVQLQKESDETL